MYGHLLFIKILLVSLLSECKSISNEDRFKYLEDVDIESSENEAGIENLPLKFLNESTFSVLMEQTSPLVEKIKGIWEKENETDLSAKKIIFSTFNSKGLWWVKDKPENFCEFSHKIEFPEQTFAETTNTNRGRAEHLLPNWQTIKANTIDYLQKITKTYPLITDFLIVGLQDTITYNETSKFLQRIKTLRAADFNERNFIPTLHAVNDLIQKNLSNGPLLLVTMSKPSDEDFIEALEVLLMRKKFQLSVLWAGETKTDDYVQLRDLATRTGGKFEFISNEADEKSDENEESDNQNLESKPLLMETVNNIPEKLQFPEEHAQNTDVNLASRAASQKNWGKISIPLIVEVASGTNLEMLPGSFTQISFTVKNNFNVPISAHFTALFHGVRHNVQPPSALLQPSSTMTVTVRIPPFQTSQLSAVGTLTLIANVGNTPMARSALIFMTPQSTTDRSEPTIKYKYEGDCSNYKEPNNCENGHWGFEATIQDEDSGLLKILSEPYALLFQSEFVAGTKTPVTVFYSATCCQSKVDVWAEDLRGNTVKRSLDVFNQNLLAGEIAAIVVGVLLLILIVISIIVGVILYKRRNRRNMIIPRSTS